MMLHPRYANQASHMNSFKVSTPVEVCMLSSEKDNFKSLSCRRIEPFDMPMSSPSFMEPLSNVRDPYKASYVPDMSFKPHTGKSPLTKGG